MYELHLEKNVIQSLSKLDKQIAKRIVDKLENLQDNPVPPDAKRIVNVTEKIFRIRIGNYRALYRLEKEQLIIVFLIDKRNRVYRT